MGVPLFVPQAGTESNTVNGDASDADLVQHARTDAQAFAHLYMRYLDRVYQYCYRRLGSRSAAEDATSLVFLKAMTGLPRFSNDRGSFRSWLFSIAHNVVVDEFRSARFTAPEERLLEITDRQLSPEEEAERSESARQVRGAIAQLPERQRQVVELRMAGLTSVEIGTIIGCKPRSVDVVQYRALGKLRTIMGIKNESQVLR